MIDASVARRYARALLSLALEEGQHERYAHELEAARAALEGSAEVRDLLANPGFSGAQRHALIDSVVSTLQLSPTLANFLRLLADRQRLADLPAIERSYSELVDAEVGRVRAVVTSATPLSSDEKNRVRDALAQATRRTVVLESRTDAAILGGLVAQVGPVLWDGSLRTQLERMRTELKEAPLT